jgi:hypothetical protein
LHKIRDFPDYSDFLEAVNTMPQIP